MANVGDYLTIKGVKKRWAGENYGWQTPASYSQLEKQGKFKFGAQLLDRLGSYLGPAIKNVQNFQQQVKDATPWLDPVDKAVTGAMMQEDRLPSSVVARGGAVTAQRLGNVLNVDPRIAGIGGLLIGAVHTSGPKAGQYKASGSVVNHPHREFIEQVGERLWQKQKPGSTSIVTGKDVIPDLLLPDNTVLSWKNQGASKVNTAVKGGATPKFTTPVPGKTYQKVEDFLGTNVSTKPNVSIPVEVPKPVVAPPEVRKQVIGTYGVNDDVADRLIKDWEREQTYRANMDIYRNDMLYQEKLLQDVVNSNLLPPAAVQGIKGNKAKGIKEVPGISAEIGELRRARRDLVSEPSYIYEEAISKPPKNIEQVHKPVYSAEESQRKAAQPVPGTQAHHQASVSSVESYLQNMNVDEVRETLDILTEMGYHIGSNKYNFMNLSQPAHTQPRKGIPWGDDYAHVGGEGRFKAEPLPKGTTPQQAAEVMKPMLDMQRSLNAAAWNHPAEQAMRKFTEEVVGSPIEWSLPESLKNHTAQKNKAILKGWNKYFNASTISEEFAKGFAQGKTYEQISNELRKLLKINGT
jgi:hypothetical protein